MKKKFIKSNVKNTKNIALVVGVVGSLVLIYFGIYFFSLYSSESEYDKCLKRGETTNLKTSVVIALCAAKHK